MKFALVEGECREAQPGLSGQCRGCGDATVAKCGRHRIWHWAHRGSRTCDPWWESETQWHRDWKDHFPKDWQEIIHSSDAGEKHIADVKTEAGVVLEFQHSFLGDGERQSRELYYPKMVWVVDARRRVRDRAQFFASLGLVLHKQPLIVAAHSNDAALFRDWKASRVPVYFDFGVSESSDPVRFEAPTLWRLNSGGANGRAYLSPVAKSCFLEVHRSGMPFDEPFTELVGLVAANYLKRQVPQYRLPTAFDQYMARKQRARRRL
ncbi:competence protein CoiA [Bradyrhizobium sp. WSM2254]|uniref:competence protein CoiA n=1 Tax=Bradyrhizobium sp. WSM2254 TaxID=1188263 RepID=UPI0007C473E0|nr:competence protein CoiA family protein [Bradyrhizobium sp. WSM2254]